MTLYAAIDPSNRICFVGDVPRGAACGCLCPICRSPMVSKQGDINVWHFAHEANQERPECSVGRDNLLRRLAIEMIAEAGHLKLPACAFTVNGGAMAPSVVEHASWENPTVSVHVDDCLVQPGARVAQLMLRSDQGEFPVDLYVELKESAHTLRESTNGRGELVFHCAPPGEGDLTTLQSAKDYLAMHGYLAWHSVTDTSGEIEKAKQRVKLRVREAQEARWAVQAKADEERRQRAAEELTHQPGRKQDPAQARAPIELPNWMQWKKSNTAYFAFKTAENEFWVLLQAAHAELVYIVPAPARWEGWDETFPPSLAKPDETRHCYVSTHPINQIAQWFYQGRNKGSRIEGDPQAIAKFTGMG